MKYELKNTQGTVIALGDNIQYSAKQSGWIVDNGDILCDPLQDFTRTQIEINPIEFNLRFTPAEQIAITDLKGTNATLKNAFRILDDPRTTTVNLRLPFVVDTVTYAINAVKSDINIQYSDAQAAARIAQILG